MKQTWYWRFLFLAVADWTWSLFIDNAPPINKNHACVLANHVHVRYRKLHERTPSLQALLDPDHWRIVRLQKGTWEPYRCVRCCSDGEFHHALSCTEEDLLSMLAVSAPKQKHCSCGQHIHWTIYWRILIWRFASKTANPPNFFSANIFIYMVLQIALNVMMNIDHCN